MEKLKESLFLHDLRKFSRGASKIETVIRVGHSWDMAEWIKCGEIKLWRPDRPENPWILSSYFLNVTDWEHDSAHIFSFPIVGVSLLSVSYGYTTITGYIAGDQKSLEDFRVPDRDFRVPLENCKYCKGEEAHKVAKDSNFYLPKANEPLYELLRGLPIEITSGIRKKA